MILLLTISRRKKTLCNQFLEIGNKYDVKTVETTLEYRMKQSKSGNCCTLVYTSGTPGNPKDIMISHDNYTWTASYTAKNFRMNFRNERMVSYLPLCHVASQIIDIASALICDAKVSFADPTALQGSLVETLNEVSKTFFSGVPRVWEKIKEKIKAVAAQNISIQSLGIL